MKWIILLALILFVSFLTVKSLLEEKKKQKKKTSSEEYLSPETIKKLKVFGALLGLYIFVVMVAWYALEPLSGFMGVSKLVGGVIIITAGLFIVSLPAVLITLFKPAGIPIETRDIKRGSRGLAFILLVVLLMRGCNVEGWFDEEEDPASHPTLAPALRHDHFDYARMSRAGDKLSFVTSDDEWSGEIEVRFPLMWELECASPCSVWFTDKNFRILNIPGIHHKTDSYENKFRIKGGGGAKIWTKK